MPLSGILSTRGPQGYHCLCGVERLFMNLEGMGQRHQAGVSWPQSPGSGLRWCKPLCPI